MPAPPFSLLIPITIVLGLAADQHGGTWGAPLVSLWTWLLFAALLWHTAPAQRPSLFACLLFATLGECFLALIWGVYDYREGGLPLFVPPGHVLLFSLGLSLAERLPARLVTGLPLLAAVAALLAAIAGDTFSLPLTALFLLCWRYGPAPRLYATMFLLALAMELYGTWLGNWRWQMQEPWLGLQSLNPPLAAGAFYCVLDLLAQAAVGRGRFKRPIVG